MKKADAKKRRLELKNADRQKKHQQRVKNDLAAKEARQKHHYDKLFRPSRPPEDIDANDERIKEQLRHNMEILEALEAEMEKEKEAKKTLNERLEEQGLHTLEEKMQYLADQAAAQQKAEHQFRDGDNVVFGMGQPAVPFGKIVGSAETSFTVNP